MTRKSNFPHYMAIQFNGQNQQLSPTGKEFDPLYRRQCSSEGLRGLDLDKSLNCPVDTAKTSKFAETEIGWIRGKLPPALSDMWLSHLRSVYKTKKTKVTSNGREGQSENSLLYVRDQINARFFDFHSKGASWILVSRSNRGALTTVNEIKTPPRRPYIFIYSGGNRYACLWYL